jgi:inorganic pyrophosphatase
MVFDAGLVSEIEYPPEDGFWEFLDHLVVSSCLVIDRPQGSAHRRYPGFTYPLDYGYLGGTHARDGGGVDVWLGSLEPKSVTGILCCIDLLKRDAELKILLGCSDGDVDLILNLSKRSSMRSVHIPRS